MGKNKNRIEARGSRHEVKSSRKKLVGTRTGAGEKSVRKGFVLDCVEFRRQLLGSEKTVYDPAVKTNPSAILTAASLSYWPPPATIPGPGTELTLRAGSTRWTDAIPTFLLLAFWILEANKEARMAT
jgi:hypothetical protein